LAHTFLDYGKYGEAQEIAEEALKSSDAYSYPSWILAQAAIGLGSKEQGRRLMFEIVARSPRVSLYRTSLIEHLDQQGRYKEAAMVALGAADAGCVAKDLAECLARLGAVRLKEGRNDEAQDAFRQAIHYSPESPVLRYRIGCAFEQNSLYAEAANVFEEVDATWPEWPWSPYALGRIRYVTGSSAAAIPYLDRAISLEPGVSYFHNYRACALGLEERFSEAIEASREAVRVGPEDWTCLAALGGFLAEARLNDQAIPYFEKALKIVRGKSPRLYVTCGLHLARKEYESVLTLLEAGDWDSDYRAEHLLDLGEAYFGLGRKEDALAKWNEVAELDRHGYVREIAKMYIRRSESDD
jgi:tetratricopeptide (TPR) repeat protein